MAQADVGTARPAPARDTLQTLEAMAGMAAQTGTVVHVVAAREAGLVARARVLAQAAGVGISVDLMAASVRVRFDGQNRAR